LDRSRGGYADNFEPLTSLDWQVHVYGDVAPAISDLCKKTGFPLHAFPWEGTMHAVGLVPNAVYLVRPDGYVGWVDRDVSATTLERYLAEWHLRPRSSSRAST
jgi:hypothetical protein